MTYIERIAVAAWILVFALVAAGFTLAQFDAGEIARLALIGAFVVAGAIWLVLRLIDFIIGGPAIRQRWRQ